MKKKVLLIGGIAAATLLVGGWALAQATGPGGFGPPFMRGMGHGGMGPGMMQRMARDGLRNGPGGWVDRNGPRDDGGTPGLQYLPTRRRSKRSRRNLASRLPKSRPGPSTPRHIQDAATAMKTAREGVDPDAISKLSPQDRFAFVTKMREQGQKQFETVKTAANELLAALDDTQKAKAQHDPPGSRVSALVPCTAAWRPAVPALTPATAEFCPATREPRRQSLWTLCPEGLCGDAVHAE